MPKDPTHADLQTALDMDKEAIFSGNWVTQPKSSLIIRVALKNQDVVIQGINLFVKCNQKRPDEQVSLGLTIEGASKPYCFARVDWRAAGSHPNTSALCGDYFLFDAGRTHYHNPKLIPSEADVMEHLTSNLPIAISVEPQPKNFADLMRSCAKLLHVNNLTEIPIPPWQPEL